ncbi:cholesterol-dependent cytolysin pyolysin [Trueperella pyogenes]|uniref:cholesterol-dependent cytolysin pyolysin n=1 Tax=Trueperella pyogenes TaxID=1661 RepID=UPI003132AE9F
MKRKAFASLVASVVAATTVTMPTASFAAGLGNSSGLTDGLSAPRASISPMDKVDLKSAQETNETSVDKYIRGLKYDPSGVLAVKGESIENVPVTKDQLKDGTYTVFKHERKSFNNLRSDISAFDANNAHVYPGALVLANKDLAKGSPTSIGIARAPQTVSVDLPGLVDGKNKVVINNPTKSSVTQGMNGLLDGWIQRNSKYPDHAAKISYDETMVTSKRQLEAKLGLGFEKVSAKLNVDFDAIHKRERQVAIASFKQIYYTASVDTPTSPHSVFGPNVTAQDLKDRGVNNKNPLGYISSVSYGRQIFVKLETTSTSNDVQAAFSGLFKAKFGNLSTEFKTKYADILNKTRATVYVVGGSARGGVEVATGNIDALKKIIKEESTFSTKVPAVPVSYAVNFLKDNQLAAVRSSGDYIETTATTYKSGEITFRHGGGYVAKFRLKWDEISYDPQGKEIRTPKTWSGNWVGRTAGFRETIQLPANARNIHVEAGEATGLAWDPWWTVINKKNLPLVPHREIVLKGTTLNPWVEENVKP